MPGGLAATFLLIVVLITGAAPASAGQQGAAPRLAQGALPAPKPDVVPAQPQIVMPDAEKIVILVRTALLTLNDAVQTGNFTVLRDRGAPGFREANSAARLSQIFSSLMSQGIDLSAVATLSPQLSETPTLDPQSNMLRLKGTFPGKPVQIRFELIFQPIAGRWSLFGLSVQPEQSAAETPAPPKAPSAKLDRTPASQEKK